MNTNISASVNNTAVEKRSLPLKEAQSWSINRSRAKDLLPVELQKITHWMALLQEHEVGSLEYSDALDDLWDSYYKIVAQNRADFCQRILGMEVASAEQLVKEIRSRKAEQAGGATNSESAGPELQKRGPKLSDKGAGEAVKESDANPPPIANGQYETALPISSSQRSAHFDSSAFPATAEGNGDAPTCGQLSKADAGAMSTKKKQRQTKTTGKSGRRNRIEKSANGDLVDTIAPLNPEEAQRLIYCEESIKINMRSLFMLGEALQEIKSKRLYRESFGTFEDYCRCKWDFTRAWAYFQIQAVEVRDNLSTVVDTDEMREPNNERQLRPLSGLVPDQQRAAWKRACEIAGTSEVTSRHVEQAVAEMEKLSPTSPAESNEPDKTTRRKRTKRPTSTPGQSDSECDDQPKSDGQAAPATEYDPLTSSASTAEKRDGLFFPTSGPWTADERRRFWEKLPAAIQTAQTSEVDDQGLTIQTQEKNSDEKANTAKIERAVRRAMDGVRAVVGKIRRADKDVFWKKTILSVAAAMHFECPELHREPPIPSPADPV